MHIPGGNPFGFLISQYNMWPRTTMKKPNAYIHIAKPETTFYRWRKHDCQLISHLSHSRHSTSWPLPLFFVGVRGNKELSRYLFKIWNVTARSRTVLSGVFMKTLLSVQNNSDRRMYKRADMHLLEIIIHLLTQSITSLFMKQKNWRCNLNSWSRSWFVRHTYAITYKNTNICV